VVNWRQVVHRQLDSIQKERVYLNGESGACIGGAPLLMERLGVRGRLSIAGLGEKNNATRVAFQPKPVVNPGRVTRSSSFRTSLCSSFSWLPPFHRIPGGVGTCTITSAFFQTSPCSSLSLACLLFIGFHVATRNYICRSPLASSFLFTTSLRIGSGFHVRSPFDLVLAIPRPKLQRSG